MAYLVGDIGGTKTDFALYKEEEGKIVCLKEKKFSSQNYPNLHLIVKEFMEGETEKISRFFSLQRKIF